MIFLILLLGFILRLVNLNQSFWLDEAAQVLESSRPWKDQLLILSDFHPPLYHLLLHFWMFMGQSEIWIRLLSVILGVLSIYCLIRIGSALLLSRKVIYFSAFLLSISSYHLWYSQEARPYMLFVFLTLLSTYFLICRKWWPYSLSLLLTLYTMYFAPFLILSHLVYVYFFQKKNLLKLLLHLIFSSIFFLPWLPSLFGQLQRGFGGVFQGWTGVVSVNAVKLVPLTLAKFIIGKSSLQNNYYYLLMISPVLVLFATSVYKLYFTKKGKILLIFFFVPLASSFFISLFYPVAAPQRLIFILPWFYLILCLGISKLPKLYMNLAFLVLISTNLFSVFDYYLNPYVQREQWRQATKYLESQKPEDSMALFIFPEPFAPFLWYQNNIIEAKGIAPVFNLRDQDLQEAVEVVKSKKRIYLFQYLSALTDKTGKTEKLLSELSYQQTAIKDFPGVGFIYIYDRK